MDGRQETARRRSAFALIATGLALAFGLTAPLSAQDEFAEFDAFLAEFRKDNAIPAVSAVIVRDREIVWEGYYGYYDDEGDLPTRAETTYKIASVTKPIAATAILAESLAGGLDLSLPMRADDGWQEVCEFFATTGIPFMKGGEDRRGNRIAPVDCARQTTLAQMLDMRANTDSFVYNPIMFARIDRAIEGAGGRPLRDIVRERVARPAGMEDTALGWHDPLGGAALRFFAFPYHVVDGRPQKQTMPDDDFRAAAGIIASPRSVAAFDIAFDAGTLVPQSIRNDLIGMPIGPLGDYRYGWFLEDWEGKRLLWHSGWNEQRGSALYLKVPERNLSLIVFANTEAIWWENSQVKAEVVESPIACQLSRALRTLTILRVGPTRLHACIPFGSHVTDCRVTACILQHLRCVEQVEGHEGCVALGEFVVEARAAAVVLLVAIGRAGPCRTDPPAIGLGRDGEADMLHRIEDAHRDVLYAVFVAGDHAAADLAVKGVLPLVVGLARMGVEFLDEALRNRAFLAQPDWCAQDDDVRVEHVWRELGPIVLVPAMLAHVRINTRREIIPTQPVALHTDTFHFEDLGHDIEQSVGMGILFGRLQRRVEQHRLEVGKVDRTAGGDLFLLVGKHGFGLPSPKHTCEERISYVALIAGR